MRCAVARALIVFFTGWMFASCSEKEPERAADSDTPEGRARRAGSPQETAWWVGADKFPASKRYDTLISLWERESMWWGCSHGYRDLTLAYKCNVEHFLDLAEAAIRGGDETRDLARKFVRLAHAHGMARPVADTAGKFCYTAEIMSHYAGFFSPEDYHELRLYFWANASVMYAQRMGNPTYDPSCYQALLSTVGLGQYARDLERVYQSHPRGVINTLRWTPKLAGAIRDWAQTAGLEGKGDQQVLTALPHFLRVMKLAR